MTNLLILLAMPEAVRTQYRDRLAAQFPEINVTLVDHHSKVGPYIVSADALVTFAPMLSDNVLEQAQRVCDNYLIGDNGPGERRHNFPEIITELG